jgi:flagellar biosynthesis protein FlhG
LNRLNLIRSGLTERAASGQIISVLSGKGGVGKSIITLNLGDALARYGKRTLLVDADSGAGDLHVLANIRADFGVAQFTGDELSLREAVSHVRDGLDLLAASNGDTVGLRDSGSAARFVSKLRTEASGYDFVLLDQGSGLNGAAVVMANASDFNILTLIPELTSIADCYGLYKHLLDANREVDCRLLLNRVESAEEGEYIRDKFIAMADRFLGQVPGYLGQIPEDRTVRSAVGSQVTVFQQDISSSAAQAFGHLADLLANRPVRERADEPGITRETISKTLAAADTRG